MSALLYIQERSTAASAGCWEWRLRLSRNGYGQAKYQGKTWGAHRLAWTLLVGPIPDGMVIDHICRNRRCVNVRHLRVVTPQTNTTENSDGPAAANAKKTRCPQGHPYEGDNLAFTPDGRRRCRQCARDLSARQGRRPEVRAYRTQKMREYRAQADA